MIAYPPAFWYPDTGTYVRLAEHPLVPHLTRPLGFVILLKLLAQTGTFWSVTLVQHAFGLVLAILAYALLQRRGVARWVSCVAAALIVFDSLALTVEHYLLPDALFTVLFAGAVIALLWRERPGVLAAAICGLGLIAAWFTKPTAMPAIVLVGLYLLVRRVGWRVLVTYAVAVAVPYLGIMWWIDGRQSVYGSQAGTALYGRAAIIADCPRLELPRDQRAICPKAGLHYDRADAYFWRRPANMRRMPWRPDGAKLMTRFSISVIRQQPADYLRSVGKETSAHFIPGVHLGPQNDCLRVRWEPPESQYDRIPAYDRCTASAAWGNYSREPVPPRDAMSTPLTRAMHQYGRYTNLIPLAMSAAVLLTLMAVVARRRVPGRIRVDTVLLVLLGPGLVVLTVAIGMYEPRYALPALPLAAITGALAFHGLRNGTQQGEK
jgi:hypothetical protein